MHDEASLILEVSIFFFGLFVFVRYVNEVLIFSSVEVAAMDSFCRKLHV